MAAPKKKRTFKAKQVKIYNYFNFKKCSKCKRLNNTILSSFCKFCTYKYKFKLKNSK